MKLLNINVTKVTNGRKVDTQKSTGTQYTFCLSHRSQTFNLIKVR